MKFIGIRFPGLKPSTLWEAFFHNSVYIYIDIIHLGNNLWWFSNNSIITCGGFRGFA